MGRVRFMCMRAAKPKQTKNNRKRERDDETVEQLEPEKDKTPLRRSPRRQKQSAQEKETPVRSPRKKKQSEQEDKETPRRKNPRKQKQSTQKKTTQKKEEQSELVRLYRRGCLSPRPYLSRLGR